MSDEDLRQLQRHARSTGEPQAILNYVDAALRSAGASIPDAPKETTRLVLKSSYAPEDQRLSGFGEVVIRYDQNLGQVLISVNGGAFMPLVRAVYRGVPSSVPPGGFNTPFPALDAFMRLSASAEAIFQILSDLGFAYRSD